MFRIKCPFSESQLEELREVFALFNASGNGLTVSELGPALRVLGIECSQDEVHHLFERCISRSITHPIAEQGTASLSFDNFLDLMSESIHQSLVLDSENIALVVDTLTTIDVDALMSGSISLADLQELMHDLDIKPAVSSTECDSVKVCDLTPERAIEMIKATSAKILTHTIAALETAKT